RQPLVYWPAIAAAGTLALLIVVSALFLVASTARSAPLEDAVAAEQDQPPELGSASEPVPPAPPTVEAAKSEVVATIPTPVSDAEPSPIQRLLVEGASKATGSTGTCAAAKSRPPDSSERFQRHGTTVDFARSPELADELARSAKKLRLVLHLSGHLEDA